MLAGRVPAGQAAYTCLPPAASVASSALPCAAAAQPRNPAAEQEKIRPIDKKLQYQIDKLLKAAAAAAGAGGASDGATGDGDGGEAAAALGDDDPLRYGPRPDALLGKGGATAAAATTGGAGGGDAAAAAGGVYRPPRLNPVSMELDERGGELSARERRQLLQAQRRAARSGLVQELAAEVAGAPEEQRMAAAGLDTAAALRERQRLAAREDVEEELFVSGWVLG